MNANVTLVSKSFKCRRAWSALSCFVALLALPAYLSARDFTYTYEGQTLTYTVLDEDAKTCSTKAGNTEHVPGNRVSGELYLPEHPKDGEIEYTLTAIGHNAFCNSWLTSVTIPNSVTIIEYSAFYNCSELTSVTIPNSVTTIGTWAFRLCSELTSVTIPNSVKTIGDNAFYKCSSLQQILVEENNPNYMSEDGVLFNKDQSQLIQCPEAKRDIYVIPNKVKTIGSYAFNECSGLTSVTIPNSVITISGSAFYRCSGLTSVTIPNSVTTIGSAAFSECSGLTSVTIPNSVTTIESHAFSFCSELTSVTIPNTVTTIGNQAFSSCSSLQQILVEENNPNYMSEDGFLFNKDQSLLIQCPGAKKDSYVIPNSVTTIGSNAFYRCSGLTSVTISNSVTEISRYAFNSCSKLLSVTIGNSVTTIGSRAFGKCAGLTEIYALPIVPPSVEEETFEDVPRDIAVYVPKGTMQTYSAAEEWNEFTNYREIEEQDSIGEIEANNGNVSAYYTLQGQRISADRVTSGVYIIRHGDKITKTYIR